MRLGQRRGLKEYPGKSRDIDLFKGRNIETAKGSKEGLYKGDHFIDSADFVTFEVKRHNGVVNRETKEEPAVFG